MRWIWIVFLLVACESGEKKITKQPAPRIPSEPKKEVLRDSKDAIHIRLNASDEAMIEGSIVTSSELESALRSAKKAKGDTATVVIYLSRKTKFGLFTNVHETLERLLQEERDSVAQVSFNSAYEHLSETQQAIIKRKHHLRIIERMQR